MTGELARPHDQRRPEPIDRPLRVAFLANSLAVGGAETQLARAAMGLASRGHLVTVAAMLDWPGHQPALRRAGVEVIQLPVRPPARALRAIGATTRLLRRTAPDVVVSFDFQANLLGRFAGHLAGVPVIVSSIRSDRFGGRMRERWIGATDRLATATTTNSDVVAGDLVERGLVAPDRIAVIPNAVDLDALQRSASVRAEVRRELGVDDRTFLWLAVGHLVERKDHPTLLRAIATLEPLLERFEIVLAGGGDLCDLEGDLPPIGTLRTVRGLGWRDDVPELMAAADALVSSSRWEGTPNAILEAAATGLPIVATRAGGTAEVVRDGVSAELVDVGDDAALAAAMARIMARSADERASMGAAGRTHVERRFAAAQVVGEWETLLRRLVDTAAVPR